MSFSHPLVDQYESNMKFSHFLQSWTNYHVLPKPLHCAPDSTKWVWAKLEHERYHFPHAQEG